jgi:hypothetical protein
MSSQNIHPHIESALKLDLRRMFSSGALYAGCNTHGTWQCTDSNMCRRFGSVYYHAIIEEKNGMITLSHHHKDASGQHCMMIYDIRLSSIPLHYGGRRWYAHCPVTGRRAHVLHKWESTAKFCHRFALDLLPTYASQRVSGNERIIVKRMAIREKLRDADSSLFAQPRRPKRMRYFTYAKYIHRELALAEVYRARIMRLLGKV